VTVSQTDDYIHTVALSPNQRQDFDYPFTECRMDSPSGRAKPKGKKSPKDDGYETQDAEISMIPQ
jgi:hypothetical protein